MDVKNNVMGGSDYNRGLGLEIGYINHLNIQLVITLNYSAVTDFNISQINRAHAKSFPAAVSSLVVA
jgi:hypothetical protein